MNFKNLYLVFLIVTSCIKVGVDEEISHQRSFLEEKKCQSASRKNVLIEKTNAYIASKKNQRWTGLRRRRKRINKQKVGPFLFNEIYLKLFVKWSILMVGTCCRQNKLCLTFKKIVSNAKILLKKLKILTYLKMTLKLTFEPIF